MDVSFANGSRYVGWLLRTNRRLAVNSEFQVARNFARAFRTDAEPGLAPSQITRWEQGTTTASREVVRRYEQLLEASPQSLVVLADTIRRSEAAGPLEVTDGRSDDQRLLYQYLDRVLAPGEMAGADWARLTELIAGQPALVLYPPRLWCAIAEQVLSELVVSENNAWLQRQEALSRLLEHPIARSHVVATCVALAEDRSSPAVIEPVSLLDVVAHKDGNRYVLQQIENPSSDRARYAGLLAAVRKVRHGHFTSDEQFWLARVVQQAVADPALDAATAPLLSQVAALLDRRMAGQSAFPRRRWVPHSDALTAIGAVEYPPGAHSVSQRIADLAQCRLADDRHGRDAVLAELVGKALFDANPDVRLTATMLIAATPYRDAVAAALLAQLHSDLSRRVEEIAPSALSTLTTFGVDIHRPLMRTLLIHDGSSADLRHAAAWATPHCAGVYPLHVWRRILAEQHGAWLRRPSATGESILHGIAYGIGTDRHYELLAELRQRGDLPDAVRRTAQWLLSSPPDSPA